MMKKVKYRRRRENKTDYKARLSLLKSELPRIAIRKTNKYIIIQLIESKEAQDFVLLTVNSKELLKYGWPEAAAGSLKSVPAAYLTGFLFAKKLKEIKKGIADLGLQRSTKGSRVYAALMGATEGGMEIPCNKEMFPSNERINKAHVDAIKKNIGGVKNE